MTSLTRRDVLAHQSTVLWPSQPATIRASIRFQGEGCFSPQCDPGKFGEDEFCGHTGRGCANPTVSEIQRRPAMIGSWRFESESESVD
jgi:hypothetical protein